MTKHLPTLLSLVAALALTLLNQGCREVGVVNPFLEPAGPIAIDGLAAEQNPGPVALDVQNRAGSVTVLVSPIYTTPLVNAKVAGSTNSPDWVAASMTTEAGRPIIRVLSVNPSDEPARPVDLTIRLPQCAGVRVRTTLGQVSMEDVAGALNVETSLPEGGGTAIFVKTHEAITEPMLLHTANGNIDLRMSRSSAGSVDANAPRGKIDIDAIDADVDSVRVNKKRWTGRINGGSNELHLNTDAGSITVQLLHDREDAKP